MFNIRNAKKSDIKSIKNICEHSFKLTSFDVDKNIKNGSGLYFFEYYVNVAFEKYPQQFYVYEEHDSVLGFIIYGVDNLSSMSSGKKIGSIILVAVNEKYQGKSIGYKLIAYIIDLFDKLNFDLITVGTDADNLSALNVYQKLGFRTILNWVTLRLCGKDNIKSSNFDSSIELQFENDIFFAKEVMDKIDFRKTNSLLYDKKISSESILSRIRNTITSDIESNNILFYKILFNKTLMGFAIMRHDTYLSNYNQVVFQRIEDIHIFSKLNEDINILRSIINILLSSHPFHIVEMLLPSNRYNLINAALGQGFYFAHSATVLHNWRR